MNKRMTGYNLIHSPATQFTEAWGGVVAVPLDIIASIGAGVALTADQLHFINPYPYARLYDIVVQIDSSGTGGNHEIDVYNAVSGGSSYLTSPFVIPSSVAAPVNYSARFLTSPLLAPQGDPYLTDSWNANTYLLPGTAGSPAVFSVRALTPATTGALSKVKVTLLMAPYDTNEVHIY